MTTATKIRNKLFFPTTKSGYGGPISRKYNPEAANRFCEVCLLLCSNWASGSNWVSEWDSGLGQLLNVLETPLCPEDKK